MLIVSILNLNNRKKILPRIEKKTYENWENLKTWSKTNKKCWLSILKPILHTENVVE